MRARARAVRCGAPVGRGVCLVMLIRPRPDIRPVKVALLNLMPNKIKTETQIARLLGASPLQVELTLLIPDGSRRKTKNTPENHLISFYQGRPEHERTLTTAKPMLCVPHVRRSTFITGVLGRLSFVVLPFHCPLPRPVFGTKPRGRHPRLQTGILWLIRSLMGS